VKFLLNERASVYHADIRKMFMRALSCFGVLLPMPRGDCAMLDHSVCSHLPLWPSRERVDALVSPASDGAPRQSQIQLLSQRCSRPGVERTPPTA